MFNKEEIKTERSQNFIQLTNQSKTWPKAFNPFISNQKTFPKSWSHFPLSS